MENQSKEQPKAESLKGNNASYGIPSDAIGPQGTIVHVGQTQTSGGKANTTSGN